jgi:hypothetical protein
MEQLTLGGLIAALEGFSYDRSVRFAFGRFEVSSVASYRGYYDELALGWIDPVFDAPSKTVRDVLEDLKSAVGMRFDGYKGGSNIMSANTPMWAARWGDAFQAVIVGVTADGGSGVLIETASAAAVGR